MEKPKRKNEPKFPAQKYQSKRLPTTNIVKSKNEPKPEDYQPKECPNCGNQKLKWGIIVGAHFINDVQNLTVFDSSNYQGIRALHCTRCNHLLGFYVSENSKKQVQSKLTTNIFWVMSFVIGVIMVIVTLLIIFTSFPN